MSIQPLHDQVVLKRQEAEHASPGGIIIPDTATEKPEQGVVVAVGKGKLLSNGKLNPMSVKAGDKVLFEKYGGREIKVDGEELLFISESNIIGIIE